jgi:hypothetical protein
MEEIKNAETGKDTDKEYFPKKGKQSSVNFKHRIRYFDWTMRLIRVFIWMLISWPVDNLIKNPIAAIKKWITF